MDLPSAHADFKAALQASPDNPDIALALGKACEQIGNNPAAMEAYSAGASAPYQKDAVLYESYVRLFASQRLGSEQGAQEPKR